MKKRRSAFPLLVLIGVLVLVGYVFITQYPKFTEKYTYPLMYEEIILSTAEEYQLDPNLVAAVVYCESSFKPDAVSSVGATGLMQIMPETGEWIAGKLGHDFDPALMTDPKTNIQYGCWYLRFLDDRFGADQNAVVAAYNAGHGNVAKWLDNRQYSPDGVQLIEIPNSEPKQYVKKVEKAYEAYKRIYGLSYEAN